VKRFALSILAVLYLAVGSGIVVNKHFCMNRLDSWEFYGKLDDKCNRCGMESTEKHGCCHDEVHVIKLTPDQKLALLSTCLYRRKYSCPHGSIIFLLRWKTALLPFIISIIPRLY